MLPLPVPIVHSQNALCLLHNLEEELCSFLAVPQGWRREVREDARNLVQDHKVKGSDLANAIRPQVEKNVHLNHNPWESGPALERREKSVRIILIHEPLVVRLQVEVILSAWEPSLEILGLCHPVSDQDLSGRIELLADGFTECRLSGVDPGPDAKQGVFSRKPPAQEAKGVGEDWRLITMCDNN